ncbi:hypothetical protein [Desertivirga brevis]|uniref:hypothetical protein n=1 Tax=Desertivirga brevis TaxID=2810310 RepID=UPI001A978607|nr:hypothetical protein [Pedobacter sp. SYSU D00873]
MKSKRNWTATYQRALALMVMFVFLFAPIVQALHHHDGSFTKVSLSVKEKVSSEKKCATCEYFAHIKGKQLHNLPPTINSILFAKPVEVPDTFNCKIYPSSIQAFTNKGPPAFC